MRINWVSQINVISPVATSIYTWSTTNGHILSTSSDGTSITVDSVGTYVITQQLLAGCSIYATDTIVIFSNGSCFVLENKLLGFNGNISNKQVQLNWTVSHNRQISYFDVERSTDGKHFFPVAKVFSNSGDMPISRYSATDVPDETASDPYYRLKIIGIEGNVSYSKTINLFLRITGKQGISIAPNPVKEILQLNISSLAKNKMQLFIYDFAGRLMRTLHTTIPNGNQPLSLTDFQGWPGGIYSLKVLLGENLFVEKMVLVK